MNKDELNNLRQRVSELEAELKNVRSCILQAESQCSHKWSEPLQSYQDKTVFVNGPMVKRGVDIWYESVARTTQVKVWERECTVCGKIEVTDKTEDKITKIPSFK